MVELSVTAEAVDSQGSCSNEIVVVPERGRVDKVKRTLIVKVGNTSRVELGPLVTAQSGISVPSFAG